MFKKIALTVLLLPALVYLFRVGLADFLRIEPSVYIEAVQNGKARPQLPRLQTAHERLLFARFWDGSNPAIPEVLGQIAVMRAQLYFLSPELQGRYYSEAIGYFDAALALRPNSALLWADRMVAGSALLEADARSGTGAGRADAELTAIRSAYHHAAGLAPWDPKILGQLVRVGAFRYSAFKAEERPVIDAAITRANQLGLDYK